MTHNDIIAEKIFKDFSAFSEVSGRWKSAGDTVVFTNGCFDVMHRGHIDYLARAADMGDRLIIGLNSDASVSRIKGKQRPVVDEESRACILASLFFVDAVVIFGEDTPEKLIAGIVPDILVKGGDYDPEGIAGRQTVLSNGGRVETLSLVPGFSTTSFIEKIIKSQQ
jgi:D-glycero-beta-D-manno-heptose 1-phosphate adenylyltransferase